MKGSRPNLVVLHRSVTHAHRFNGILNLFGSRNLRLTLILVFAPQQLLSFIDNTIKARSPLGIRDSLTRRFPSSSVSSGESSPRK